MFTEVRTTRTYKKIIEQIKENIKNKKLKKGDKLPPERLMAEQMGVSRLSVREALSYLIAMGLVENKAGSGNYIRSDISDLLYEPINMYILLEDIDFEEVLTLRKSLQMQCINMCIDNITYEDLNELERICNGLNVSEDCQELIELDDKFHSYIVKGTNKKLINIFFKSISELVKEYISDVWAMLSSDEKNLKELVNLYFDVYIAIKNKDKFNATLALQKHFEFIEKYIDPSLNNIKR